MSTAAGVAAELTFERTLDRRLVHRAAVSGVLLTSLSEEPGGRWVGGFQLSRQHVGHAASSRVPVRLGAEIRRTQYPTNLPRHRRGSVSLFFW